MKNMNPKVSIVIPVYNGSNYLKEAIDSALAQTYENLEIIVVNDGSNDDGATETIAKSYGNQIRYFKKENGGVATALNMGIKKMTGEYFSWLSHDDIYYPDKVEKQIKYLNKLKDKKVVLFSNYSILEGGKKGTITFDHEMLGKKPKYSLLRGCVNGITVLIPKEILNEFGVFNSELRCTQDYDYWLKIQKKYPFIHIENVLAITRIHPGQDTSSSPLAVTEGSTLWVRMIKGLADAEKIEYEGSVYNFYVEMLKFMKALTPYEGAIKYCREKLNEAEKMILDDIKKTKTKITAITPTYNRADFIKETMQSILDQNYNDYKYIIIDDGSKDNTTKVVYDFIKDKKNWFYLYQDNKGEPETVNRGWSLCNSEYFVQVNSDDLALPNLFSEMVTVIDKNPKCILAYPDFYIIDRNGKIIDDEVNSDFDFLKDLSMFSCYPACPGAFIRKSALKNWGKIRNSSYKYISDVDMIWRMALCGDFTHVPSYLASWRSHEQGISNNRYESIPEVEKWVDDYFSNKNLPKKVKGVEIECRKSILSHFARLMDKSNLEYAGDMANYYREKAKMPISKYVNLQVGDNDLIGNKFNGHDLHLHLRDRNVESYHLVINKQSDDNNTYMLGADKADRDCILQNAAYTQTRYDLDCINNPLMYDILYNKLFLDSDVAHFHLMHNGILDLNLLPVMSKIKPIVWTLHDTWSVFSDPSSSDAEYLFPSNIKNLPLNYEIKKAAIQNSNVTFITASKYIKDIVEKSPMYKGKEVFHVPFGLNLDIFYPRGRSKTRKEFGFKESDKIVILRGNIRHTKGLDYIEYIMKTIGQKYDIRFLVVGGNDLEDIPQDLKINNYGWINDDELMAKLFSVADLLLMPSTREAFGMMAIEAMACGTVPVVINGTALPDTINSPECGLSTDRDKKKYCKAVEDLLNNPDERAGREQKCVEYIKQNHGIDKYVDSIEAVYKHAMSKHKMGEEDKYLLAEIKRHNETMPRQKISINYDGPRAKLPMRLVHAFRKTRDTLRTQGVDVTTQKILKKLKSKYGNKFKAIPVVRGKAVYNKLANSIKRDGLSVTSKKAVKIIRNKLAERR